MTANAPYYQMRAGQFITTPNSTNAAPSQFVSDEDEYDLSASAAVASPLDHHLHPHLYSEHSARQTPSDHTLGENHNLVELLEAATAAGQAATAMEIDDAITPTSAPQGRGKRKRVTSSPAADTSSQAGEAGNAKRRRPMDRQLPDSDCDMRAIPADGNAPPSGESLLNDARAAGVHSAAALFRRSSERKSRKYTRPPMSKLFMSLQLSPENFLQLQASAKAYMLDSSHPERQNCVGNRGKGDTDMVKLRLFNCVRDFLNDKVGEQFFGEHVEKPGENDAIEAARALGEDKTPDASERLTWPRDGNKIISLVTPLMRRMVTNERQRQYAIETRKGGAKKKDKEGSAEATIQQSDSNPGCEVEQQLQTALDSSLDHHPQASEPASPSMPAALEGYGHHAEQDHVTLGRSGTQALNLPNLKHPTVGPSEPNLSHINIFLVLPSASRSSIKHDEKRITAEPHAHLAWYDYGDFMREVLHLLKKIKAKYPQTKARLKPQESNPGTGSLQGLAAAANALQTEDAHYELSAMGNRSPSALFVDPSIPKGVSSASPTSVSAVDNNALDHADHDAETRLLPRYIIKSIGPEGWREIRNADDWYSVLREKAFAVWADGVCNILVELVDVPACVNGPM